MANDCDTSQPGGTDRLIGCQKARTHPSCLAGLDHLRHSGSTYSAYPTDDLYGLSFLESLGKKNPWLCIRLLNRINNEHRIRIHGKMASRASLSRADLMAPSRGDVVNALDRLV